MAEIKPFRAWRYSKEHAKQIEDLISPHFDSLSDTQRQAMYQKQYNSIHLAVQQGHDAATSAGQLLAEWKRTGIMEQDPLPGIYVYYQYFKVAGSSNEYYIKGFVSNIRVYDWDESIILCHENTIPNAANDGIEMLEKTELNVIPTHGLYTDAGNGLEPFMDEAMSTPLLEAVDSQGVRHVLAVIHDAAVIQKFIDNLNDKTITLEDGYHRYVASLLYKKKCMATNAAHTGKEGYNFHLMYLTNSEALKSPYLYPKVICGLLYSSIKQDEFQTPYYSRF